MIQPLNVQKPWPRSWPLGGTRGSCPEPCSARSPEAALGDAVGPLLGPRRTHLVLPEGSGLGKPFPPPSSVWQLSKKQCVLPLQSVFCFLPYWPCGQERSSPLSLPRHRGMGSPSLQGAVWSRQQHPFLERKRPCCKDLIHLLKAKSPIQAGKPLFSALPSAIWHLGTPLVPAGLCYGLFNVG